MLLTSYHKREIVQLLDTFEYRATLEPYTEKSGQKLLLIHSTRGLERVYPVYLPRIPRHDNKRNSHPSIPTGGTAQRCDRFMIMSASIENLLMSG